MYGQLMAVFYIQDQLCQPFEKLTFDDFDNNELIYENLVDKEKTN